MKTTKLALAAALLAALPAFAAQHDGKTEGQTAQPQPGTNAPMTAGTNVAPAGTNAPAAASAEAPAAQPMPSYEQKKPARVADESVKQLQQSLKDKGFDPGPIDGVMGPRTQAALDASKQSETSASTSSSAASGTSASASTNQPSAASESSTPAKQ